MLFSQNGSVSGIFTSVIFGAIGGLLGLTIYALIVYAICKALGGTGTLQTQIALLGIFTPPHIVTFLLLGQSPILGAVIGLVLSIFEMFLYVLATQAVQNVTVGKAAIAVLLPYLVVLWCIVVFTLGLLAAILPWSVTTGSLSHKSD